jgi:putative transposase
VAIRVFFSSRSDTALEILALRQQIAVLKRKRPRPRLNSWDRLFWTTLRQCWSRWTDVLVLVKPDAVVAWHRAGFRLYWRWRSRPLGGRPAITEEIRVRIRRLAQENQDWGAPKIHGELQKLGFVVSERSVARYLRRMRRRGDPGKSWLTFLQNHREVIAAFDFLTVPTVTFQLLYCFFVIEHGRHRILHFNVTDHPTAEWVVQQLREAFPEAGPYRYAIFDRDSTFNEDVVTFLEAKRTSVEALWPGRRRPSATPGSTQADQSCVARRVRRQKASNSTAPPASNAVDGSGVGAPGPRVVIVPVSYSVTLLKTSSWL